MNKVYLKKIISLSLFLKNYIKQNKSIIHLLTGSISKYVLCSSSFGFKPSIGSEISGLACRK
jgi:hypothetical protein